MIYSSICIPNKNYYYQIAIFNLKSELNKQILKDGCHFQRNPKIHIQVLMDLLDIRVILNSTKKNIFFDLQNRSEEHTSELPVTSLSRMPSSA